MDDNPHQPPEEDGSPKPDNRHRTAFRLFLGVWLIGSCITLVFMTHVHDPFQSFTWLLPVPAVPLLIVPYAALLAAFWMTIPSFKIEFFNELAFTGVMIIGGLFAPHSLTIVADLFRAGVWN